MSSRVCNLIKFSLTIFVVLFIMLNINISNTYAAEQMAFNLDDVSGKPGDEVTVNLRIANNQGVRVLAGKISFDRSKLDYVGCELKNLEKATNKDIQYNESTGNIVFYATTMTNDNEPINDNDVIVTIKLKIKPEATGTASVNIAMDDVTSGINQTITDYTQRNATVTIEGTSSGENSGSTDSNGQGAGNNGENGNSQNPENQNDGDSGSNGNGENNGINGDNNNEGKQSENGNSEGGIQGNIEPKKSPTTGDIAVGILIALLLISVIGITIILIKRKKKK